MSRWLRLYDEVVDDPKVQSLAPDLFKAWVNVLCIAGKYDGVLPAIETVAFHLRCDGTVAERTIERLLDAGLIDKRNGGLNGYHYAPHGWDKRQFKSDTSSERVKRYRDRKRTVSETPPETETDTDSSVSKDTADSAPENPVQTPDVIDPTKIMFDAGVALLATAAVPEGRARTILGRWRRQFGEEAVIAAIGTAKREGAIDPISFIEGVFRGPANRTDRQGRDRGATDPFTAVCRDVASRGTSSAKDG